MRKTHILAALSILGIGLILGTAFNPFDRHERPEPDFEAWGVPEQLASFHTRLELLQLPPSVTDVSWITSPQLKTLLLEESSATHLSSFPPGLVTLDLESAGQLTKISNYPASLKRLNLQRTNSELWRELPADITFLGLGNTETKTHQDLSLSGDALKGLIAFKTPIENLSGLEVLTDLVLIGSAFSGADTLPGIRNLTLEMTNHANLKNLPQDSIKSLALRGLAKLQYERMNLPPNLLSLQIKRAYRDDFQVTLPEDFPFPQSLEQLHLPDGLFTLKRAIPSSIVKLNLLPNGTLKIEGQPSSLHLLGSDESDVPTFLGAVSDWVSSPELRLQTDTTLANVKGLEQYVSHLRLSEDDSTDDYRESLKLALNPSSWTRLKVLNINDTQRIVSIGSLPKTLEVLAAGRSSLKELPQLPNSLRVLDIRDTEIDTTNLSVLANTRLETLVVTSSFKLDLAHMPSTLTHLFLVREKISEGQLWSHFRALTNTVPYVINESFHIVPE